MSQEWQRSGLGACVQSATRELNLGAGPQPTQTLYQALVSNAIYPVKIDGSKPYNTDYEADENGKDTVSMVETLQWSQCAPVSYSGAPWSVFRKNVPSSYDPTNGRVAEINEGANQSSPFYLSDIVSRIVPVFPSAPAPNIEQETLLFSWWNYHEGAFSVWSDGFPYAWNNIYAVRARFQCNRPVSSLWVGNAQRYTAAYNYARAGDPSKQSSYDPADPRSNPVDIIKLLNVTLVSGPATLPANTWFEVPLPGGNVSPVPPLPTNLAAGYIGQMNFAIWGETPSAWSLRTGIPIQTS